MMSILFILLPVSAVLAGVAVTAFVWSVRRGQLDDLETPAYRILHEERTPGRGPANAGRAVTRT